MEQRNFVHSVYFWLNNPNNKQERESFITSLSQFINNSKYIKTKFIGVPADTNREVIDNSYTFSLILTFQNKEQQDKYQAEEGHLKFIADASSLWAKVLVYDSESIRD